jgi:NTP pyrophosphatase (non-canonical NTP hydrolase)
MDDKNRETLVILQEECAEVVQATAKIFRFGMDQIMGNQEQTNIKLLEGEIGDVLAMIDLLQSQGLVSKEGLNKAKKAKIEKLKKWSHIYE